LRWVTACTVVDPGNPCGPRAGDLGCSVYFPGRSEEEAIYHAAIVDGKASATLAK
jgi:hypothetical protein